MNLKSIGCLLPLMTLVLMGCSTIPGTGVSEETGCSVGDRQTWQGRFRSVRTNVECGVRGIKGSPGQDACRVQRRD